MSRKSVTLVADPVNLLDDGPGMPKKPSGPTARKSHFGRPGYAEAVVAQMNALPDPVPQSAVPDPPASPPTPAAPPASAILHLSAAPAPFATPPLGDLHGGFPGGGHGGHREGFTPALSTIKSMDDAHMRESVALPEPVDVEMVVRKAVAAAVDAMATEVQSPLPHTHSALHGIDL